MKRIMFNDNFGLTKAVLEGRKTMTRRIIDSKTLSGANDYVQRIHGTGLDFLDYLLEHSRYKVGEEVAVAQSYLDIHEEMMAGDYDDSIYDPFRWAVVDDKPGWNNKMFVRADLMPHQIRITDIKVEQLQDISEDDCLREGIIRKWIPAVAPYYYYVPGVEAKSKYDIYPTAREAFAALIDKVSGKGTWAANPRVFVYSFELVV